MTTSDTPERSISFFYSRLGDKPPNLPADQRNAAQLKEQIQTLRRQILAAQNKRKNLTDMKDQAQMLQRKWMERKNQAQHRKNDAISSLQSVVSRRIYIENRLEATRRMNAINDCFHIWHKGVYGTINGLRMGSFVPPVSSAIYPSDSCTPSTTGRLDFDLSSIFFDPGTFNQNDPSNSFSQYKVSWSETNAALGSAALLLVTLQGKQNANIHFSTYDIIPMGSFSKIVTKVKANASATVYNLYSDDRFSFFGKRNFNMALQGILRCLFDAGEAVAKRDKTMEYPYPITEISRGELVIGGLPIIYGNDNERWTRALKYFLTDLKWLVAFVVKHADT